MSPVAVHCSDETVSTASLSSVDKEKKKEMGCHQYETISHIQETWFFDEWAWNKQTNTITSSAFHQRNASLAPPWSNGLLAHCSLKRFKGWMTSSCRRDSSERHSSKQFCLDSLTRLCKAVWTLQTVLDTTTSLGRMLCASSRPKADFATMSRNLPDRCDFNCMLCFFSVSFALRRTGLDSGRKHIWKCSGLCPNTALRTKPSIAILRLVLSGARLKTRKAPASLTRMLCKSRFWMFICCKTVSLVWYRAGVRYSMNDNDLLLHWPTNSSLMLFLKIILCVLFNVWFSE